MDRWGDGDGLDRGPKAPLTGVSKMGMSAFIKSSGSGSSERPEDQRSKIEVVASKREQKRAQMPPPPVLQPIRAGQPPPPGAFKAPDWAGTPPAAARLEVLKDGHVIQSIPLEQPATIFGRSPTADVVLDHPSLSRQHAAVCYNRLSREWVVLDLDSAHGTKADGRPAPKGAPMTLKEGSTLHFAASSREYVLRRGPSNDRGAQHKSAAAPEPPAKRRKAVQWPDEATNAAEQSSQQLEKVIGYSDGGEFASRVGPQPIESSSGSGRFADLVQSRIVSKKDKEGKQQQEQGQEAEATGDQDHQQWQQRDKAAAKKRQTEEALRRHIAQPFLKQSMYDFLPPPSQSSAQPS
ncbi:g8503 [Coccomyxa viridis]|uniref:G8503 protein n=1 Tax=Coccomyxa viridis TaxID=1274662 RepID=A0ABP1G0H8_9CHLO